MLEGAEGYRWANPHNETNPETVTLGNAGSNMRIPYRRKRDTHATHARIDPGCVSIVIRPLHRGRPVQLRRNVDTCFWSTATVVFILAVAVACDDSGLYPATYPNYVDTVTLYALRGTPIATPSAFDIAFGITARTDQGEAFDFAFDIDSLGAAILLPAGALGLTAEAGLQLSDEAFDEIDEPPDDGYIVDSVLTVSLGDVFVGRSRNTTGMDGCSYYGELPRYGKFRVLELDFENRTVLLEALVNLNCGYRELEPGYPTS